LVGRPLEHRVPDREKVVQEVARGLAQLNITEDKGPVGVPCPLLRSRRSLITTRAERRILPPTGLRYARAAMHLSANNYH